MRYNNEAIKKEFLALPCVKVIEHSAIISIKANVQFSMLEFEAEPVSTFFGAHYKLERYLDEVLTKKRDLLNRIMYRNKI